MSLLFNMLSGEHYDGRSNKCPSEKFHVQKQRVMNRERNRLPQVRLRVIIGEWNRLPQVRFRGIRIFMSWVLCETAERGEPLKTEQKWLFWKASLPFRKSSVRVLPQLCTGKENDRTSEQNVVRETDTKLNLRNKCYPSSPQFPWSPHHDCPAIHTNTCTHAHAHTHTHTHTHTSLSLSSAEMVSTLVN